MNLKNAIYILKLLLIPLQESLILYSTVFCWTFIFLYPTVIFDFFMKLLNNPKHRILFFFTKKKRERIRLGEVVSPSYVYLYHTHFKFFETHKAFHSYRMKTYDLQNVSITQIALFSINYAVTDSIKCDSETRIITILYHGSCADMRRKRI